MIVAPQWVRTLIVAAIVQAVTMHPSSNAGAAMTNSATCSADDAATFAWWTGVWDYTVPGYDSAVSTVTASSDGCSLSEDFVDRGGQKQHTTIQYDSAAHQWRRVVVDPFRTYRSAGAFAADGSISFYETPADRESYRVVDHQHVRFTGEKSSDGGKTWRLLFGATYTRRPVTP